jgi:putative ABC transport system permease protein
MALGASESRTLWLIVRQALSVVGAGVLIGGIASVFLGRYIGSMLYGVVPMDPATYGMVVLLLILVGGVAAAIPAARAARVDPVIALRGS